MILESINNSLKESIRSKNEEKLAVLRMLKSVIKNKEIEKKQELPEDEVILIIHSEIKKRKESAEIYKKADRSELADKETRESEILSEFLPEQMSSEDLELLVKDAIKETGAKSKSDMGRVMSVVMSKVSGKASGSDVSKKVSSLLS